MSQKKVDEYKKYKQNRRANIKKEQRKNKLTIAAMWAVLILVIAAVGAAIGVSIYNNYKEKLASMPTYSTTSYILADLAGIQEEEESSEEATENETEDASETDDTAGASGAEQESSEEVTK